MTSFVCDDKLDIDLLDIPQIKCLSLQEYQQLCSDLDKARQEIANLNQKLCHARRNLEDEKRNRRVAEHHKNLLQGQVRTVTEVLFHDEQVNLDEKIKQKLQFLNKPAVEIKYNNLYIQDKQSDRHLTTIAETDSTGSILSDLNCLSKSEDDLDTDTIIKTQRKWKEYKPSDIYIATKHCRTLDKVAEFYSMDKTTTEIKPNNDTVSFKVQSVSNKENIDFEQLNTRMSDHYLISKMVIKPETCSLCGKRIRFGKIVLKCKNCTIICHAECKILILPLSCVHK